MPAGLPALAAAAAPLLSEALDRVRHEVRTMDDGTFMLWLGGLVLALAVVMLGIRPTR